MAENIPFGNTDKKLGPTFEGLAVDTYNRIHGAVRKSLPGSTEEKVKRYLIAYEKLMGSVMGVRRKQNANAVEDANNMARQL